MTNYVLWAILRNKTDPKHDLGSVKSLTSASSLVFARKIAMKMMMLEPNYKMIDIQEGKIIGKSVGTVRLYGNTFFWIPASDAQNGKRINRDGTLVR